MLDDLRREADASLSQLESEALPKGSLDIEPQVRDDRLFGMTPLQRLILAVMLLLITLLIGSFCLLVTGKVVPPGMFWAAG